MSAARRAHPRRAIVLGGGGVLGFAWILGALAALESAAEWDARDAELLIGTSAGSVTAALLGCGLGVDALCRHHQGIPAPADPQIAYDYESATGEALPPRPGWRPASPRLVWDGLRHPRQVSPIVALCGLLPEGRASLNAVHALVSGVAGDAGFATDWPAAPRPWIVAVDYSSGRRVVFGREPVGTDASGRPRPIRRATLADAVRASCSIPGWYPPTVIDGVPYIDGGAISNASVDLLGRTDVDEAYVLAPMAALELDRPRSAIGRLERRIRRAITRRVLADAEVLRADGMRVTVVAPVAEDLTAMGVNLMDPGRRSDVLETARETTAAQLRRQWGGGHAGPARGAGRASAR